jgi:hypothetical protein
MHSLRHGYSLVLRIVVLTIILFACFAIAGALAQPPRPEATAGPDSAVLALVAVCFIDTLVLSYVILCSRWSGWRLAGTVFFVFFGVATFMGLIEAAVFVTGMPPGALPRLFLMGALIAAPFSPLAVLTLGKWKAAGERGERSGRLIMRPGAWGMKLGVIAAAYVILYFTFGYFVAWRNPVVRAYYGGADEGSFFAHMAEVLASSPWLVPFQVLRALLWVLLALPVIRMTRGGWPATALAIALLFSVLMNAQLLLPNPYMPATVRMVHLVETASSNFLFGWLVGWLLTSRREPAAAEVVAAARAS